MVFLSIQDGNSPIRYAARDGDKKVLEVLLKHGVDFQAADKVGVLGFVWEVGGLTRLGGIGCMGVLSE